MICPTLKPLSGWRSEKSAMTLSSSLASESKSLQVVGDVPAMRVSSRCVLSVEELTIFSCWLKPVLDMWYSHVTVMSQYIYSRYSHLKSLASYFGLQLFSLTQTGYGPQPLDCAPTAVFIVLSSSAGILDAILGTLPQNTYPYHSTCLHCDWVAGTLVTIIFSFHLNWHFRYFRLSSVHFDSVRSKSFARTSTRVPARRLSLISPLLHQSIRTSHVFLNSAFWQTELQQLQHLEWWHGGLVSCSGALAHRFRCI